MTYRLFIMDRAYSSWSLRGHLMLAAFDIAHETVQANWPGPEWDALLARIAPSRTAPSLEIEESGQTFLCWDSLAIAETLAERHPLAGHWPKAPPARAAARALAAEMHSGFQALRAACPMNLKAVYAGYEPSEAVLADVARIRELWSWARKNFGGDGPFLFGDRFTAADAFFTPVASRFASFNLPMGRDDEAYIDALHRVPSFRRWRAMALANPHVIVEDVADLPVTGAFGPGETPLPARAVAGVRPINDSCPYSGKPVAEDSLAEIDGVIVGYCNRFCRDKSVADAGAWPETVELLRRAKAGEVR
ncbi:glutathione S-transferase [Pikeienuella piscinae]|uniref:Glutathione S-transferase n=1 Tax=Pikeienuella piscinae TaxID=2748098 RepID=A0A7M3T5C7_9RHOB|nr:glutathione S-transferase [Pikeienuella piscinae]QIE57208.1 glutathione S-transferase [Pikeienuella piscinae]